MARRRSDDCCSRRRVTGRLQRGVASSSSTSIDTTASGSFIDLGRTASPRASKLASETDDNGLRAATGLGDASVTGPTAGVLETCSEATVVANGSDFFSANSKRVDLDGFDPFRLGSTGCLEGNADGRRVLPTGFSRSRVIYPSPRRQSPSKYSSTASDRHWPPKQSSNSRVGCSKITFSRDSRLNRGFPIPPGSSLTSSVIPTDERPSCSKRATSTRRIFHQLSQEPGKKSKQGPSPCVRDCRSRE